MGGVASKDSLTSSSRAHFSLADLFSPSTYKMSSSSVLQALGKFLPVNYQKGVNSAVSGCPYHIGDFAQGGVIIWLTNDGMHGLVAAIEDASPAGGSKWAKDIGGTYVETGATYNDPLPYATPVAPYGQYYSGYQNQKLIANNYNLDNYPAFKDAAGYSITVNGITYNDWFLPSSSELSLMYASRGVINQVSLANGGAAMLNVEFNPNSSNFPASIYWSSRENDTFSAWVLNFFNGDQDYFNLDNPCAVRCVRAF